MFFFNCDVFKPTTCVFLHQRERWKLAEFNTLQGKKKRQYLPYHISDKSLKGSTVNRVCNFLMGGGALENLTFTAPLIY